MVRFARQELDPVTPPGADGGSTSDADDDAPVLRADLLIRPVVGMHRCH